MASPPRDPLRTVRVLCGQLSLSLELPLESDSAGSWTGGQIWRSGVVLADWIARNPETVRGKRVLELGAPHPTTGVYEPD